MTYNIKKFLGIRLVIALVSLIGIATLFGGTLVSAAPTDPATWKDKNTLTHNGITYTGPFAMKLNYGMDGNQFDANVFKPASGNTILFFPKTANMDTATNINYNNSVSGIDAITVKLTNLRSAVPAGTPPAGSTTPPSSVTGDEESCNIAGVGWLVCPVATAIGWATDGMYNMVEQLLVFNVENPFGNNALFVAWSNIRNFANAAFIVAIFVVIFSQATSMGISNYGIKKMLPRIIVSAILVNLSYYLCIFAIDVSNILGAGLDGIINAARAGVGSGQQDGLNLSSWVANALIGAGAAAGFFAASSAIAAGGSIATILGGLALTFGLTALMAILTALVVLVGRQAILIMLIIISPLAFVAYILPNTESMFDKWRKLFITMLVFYPFMALLFSGSKLAAELMRSASGNALVDLFSIGVQAFPLFATPFILKFSGGILGRLGGMVNNPNKGPFDRLRKAGEERLEAQRNKNLGIARNGELGNKGILQRRYSKAVGKRDKRLQKYGNWEYEANRAKTMNDAKRLQDKDFAADAANADAFGSPDSKAYQVAIARTQARGIATEDKLIGEEASAAKTVIENAGLSEKQKQQLSVQGFISEGGMRLNENTQKYEALDKNGDVITDTATARSQSKLSGDFYQKSMHSQYAAQGRINELERAVTHSEDMSDDVRSTLAYYLDQSYSTLKAKGHYLNDDELKIALRTPQVSEDGTKTTIKITDAMKAEAAARTTASLNAEFLATQDPFSLGHLHAAIESGAVQPEKAADVRAALQAALDNPTTSAKFTESTRETAQAIINNVSVKDLRDRREAAAEAAKAEAGNKNNKGVFVTQESTLRQALPSIPQPDASAGTVTQNFSIDDIKLMTPTQVNTFISRAGGSVAGMDDNDLAKLAHGLAERPDAGQPAMRSILDPLTEQIRSKQVTAQSAAEATYRPNTSSTPPGGSTDSSGAYTPPTRDGVDGDDYHDGMRR